MEGKDTEEDFEGQSREDDRNVLEDGSPVPDPTTRSSARTNRRKPTR